MFPTGRPSRHDERDWKDRLTVSEPRPSDPPLMHVADAWRVEGRTAESEEEPLREDEGLGLCASRLRRKVSEG